MGFFHYVSRGESGNTLPEYAILAAILCLVVLASMGFAGDEVNNTTDNVSFELCDTLRASETGGAEGIPIDTMGAEGEGPPADPCVRQ